MQKIHKQNKLSIGNIRITEMLSTLLKKIQIKLLYTINISEPIWTILRILGMEQNLL